MSGADQPVKLGPNGRPVRPFVMPDTLGGKLGVWRYLLMRRAVQLGILLLFLGTVRAGWEVAGRPVLSGNLSSSELFGLIPMADPFAVLQIMLTGQLPLTEVLIGGHIDGYNSYSQRGTLPRVEDIMASAVELFPRLSRLRLMRQWAGVMDMSMDGSPIISKTPLENFFINGGWCYGGFKATPGSGWVFAHTIAHNRPHPLSEAFRLGRFATGHALDERGAGPKPQAH